MASHHVATRDKVVTHHLIESLLYRHCLSGLQPHPRSLLCFLLCHRPFFLHFLPSSAQILTFETPGSIQEIVCRPFTSINHIKMTVREEKEMLSKTKRRHGRIRYFNPFLKKAGRKWQDRGAVSGKLAERESLKK